MKTNLPPILETKLADFRKRVWIVKLAEGLLAALFGIALSYLLVFALDRFFETPASLRLCILMAAAATLGVGLPMKWHQWVWRQRRLEDAARLLRGKFPRLGDQLFGIVELARIEHAATGRSDRLVEAAMAQAAEAVKDQDFRHAVPRARHREWSWAAGGAIALTLVTFALVDEAARNAFARWVMPWENVERYTFTRVETLPAQWVVPYAEPVTLPVRLAAETRRSPAAATARIEGQPKISSKQASAIYHFNLPPQKHDGRLAVVVGDVRKWITVQPRPRPELTELAMRLHFARLPGVQVGSARGGARRYSAGAQGRGSRLRGNFQSRTCVG